VFVHRTITTSSTLYAVSKAPLWFEPAPGARKPRFTRDQIAEVALAIADKDGFEALSMRRIAEELGAGTMTLYHYVRTKDDLMALMDDALMGECVRRTGKLPRDWRRALAAIARAMRDTFLGHPWALHSLQGARLGPNGLLHVEQSLAAVEDLHVDLATKLQVLSIVDDYAFGHLLRSNDSGAIPPPSDREGARLVNELTQRYLATGAYPRLQAVIGEREPMVAFADFGRMMTAEERFDVGLEALLDGIARRFARPARRARATRSGTPRRTYRRR